MFGVVLDQRGAIGQVAAESEDFFLLCVTDAKELLK